MCSLPRYSRSTTFPAIRNQRHHVAKRRDVPSSTLASSSLRPPCVSGRNNRISEHARVCVNAVTAFRHAERNATEERESEREKDRNGNRERERERRILVKISTRKRERIVVNEYFRRVFRHAGKRGERESTTPVHPRVRTYLNSCRPLQSPSPFIRCLFSFSRSRPRPAAQYK